MEFSKILTEKERDSLSNAERRKYLKWEKEQTNKHLISQTDINDDTKGEISVHEEISVSGAEPVVAAIIEAPATVQPAIEEPSKKGRPKGTPLTKLSFNIPTEYIDTINLVTGIKYGGNKSAYIVSLIKKDIEENGNLYDRFKSIANLQ